MRLCLGESRGEVSGCRSAAILPSGSFNSLQLDTFKKLLIPYGKLSISAVLATARLVCRLPLAIKLFLSDYLLSQTGWSLWSEVQAACSRREPAPRSDGAGDGSQVAIPGDAGSRSEQQLVREKLQDLSKKISPPL